MIPRFKPVLGSSELLAALIPARRDAIDCFEKQFARIFDQKYALAFPYGRTGLLLLLEALNLKGREIICPAYTCVVVPHAVVYSGNKPVFVDCEPGSFNMDFERMEEVVTESTGGLIATSLFGYPVDLDRLNRFRERYPHVHIIQDCAHSFGANWKGRSVQKEGVAALFGLNVSKILTSVFGGMITTNSGDLYYRLRKLRDFRLTPASRIKSVRRLIYLIAAYLVFQRPIYSIVNQLERRGILDYFVRYYDETEIDMPSDYLEKMTPLEARVGSTNLTQYDGIIKRHRGAAD